MIRTLYSPLIKAEENDDGTLTVEGIASAETVDAMGETILAAAMEAALPEFFAYGTGNLREMHQLSAAGTVDVAEVNDDGLTRISATVVDPVAIKKVQSGTYKGFSIGGKVLARDPKDRKVITKIRLVEISLVDRPCNPDAKIEVWKADAEGTSMDPETEGAAAPEPVTPPVAAPAAATTAPVPAAEVAKAEPAAVEAPAAPAAETPAEAPVAPSVVETSAEPAPVAAEAPAVPEAEPAADEAAKADGGTVFAPPAPLARAMAALDALDAAVTKAAGGEDLAKGMYIVRSFADVLSSIAYIVSDLKSEAEFEGDNSPVPAKMQAWLLAGVPLFKEMAAEEIDELVARVTAQKAERATALTAAAEADALSKAQALVADETAALKAQIDERDSALVKLADRVEPLAATVDALSKRLAAVEAQPAPPKTAGVLGKAAVIPVSKEQDAGGIAASEPQSATLTAEDARKALEALPEQERGHLLMKAAPAMPRRIG